MEFKGFVSFFCNKAIINKKEIEIIDPSDVYFKNTKPWPSVISLPEQEKIEKEQGKEALKDALEKSMKEFDDWDKDRYISKEAEEEVEKFSELNDQMYRLMIKKIKETGWKYNGGDYQNQYVPVFEENGIYVKLCLGMRSWGGLMYEAEYELKHNIEEYDAKAEYDDYEEMGYMNWYCDNPEKPVYPPKKLCLKETGFNTPCLDDYE